MRKSVLLDADGQPLISAGTHHYGADLAGGELALWRPPLVSADGELLQERETLVARTQDMIRNHGLLNGAVQTHLDNIIGAGLRLSAKPDYVALGQSREWAQEWQRKTEAAFRQWADDIDCFCDATRRNNFAGLLAQGYRSYLLSYEIVASAEWLPRPGAKYATAIQMIDPSLMSTPAGQSDSDTLRGGVQLGQMGEPIGYWFASGFQADPFPNAGMRKWKYVPRETPWGRRQIIHIFETERPGQTRGKNGLVSVLAKMKMLEKYEQATLQAAILNAMYAAVIESSLDWTSVGAALGASSKSDPVGQYVRQKAAFHSEGTIRYNGVKIPHLYPGEQLKFLQPQHPTAAFSSFEEAVLRYLAGGFNLSYEQLSRDYSKTNYSSARAAMLEAWKFFQSRRYFIGARFATEIYALWLEEAMSRGIVETPPGAPTFWEAKTAWTRCAWIGPGRSHIDPQKESAAMVTDLGAFVTTLEKECAERGLDWEEVLEQRALELRRMSELLGVDVATLLNMSRGSAPARQREEDEREEQRSTAREEPTNA